MAKSILDELEALVGKDAAAKITANADIAGRLAKGQELYQFYTEGETDPDDEAAARAAQVEADRKKMAEKAEADRLAAERAKSISTSSTGEMATVLSELQKLTATIGELTKFKESAITIDKLPGYESAILRKTHELGRIESNHQKEFGEDWDLEKFDGWVNEQKKTGAGWPSITAAYNSWVQEKRIEARVAKEVAEQVKQKTSSLSVPAQTTSASLSPAQQIIADSRKTSSDGSGKTNAQKAAERLAQIERSRGEGAAA